MDFSDKVVVITGAARGLGQTYALRFAELGARLAVCDLRDCAETAEKIRDAGAEALATSTDVTDAGSLAAFAEAIGERYGRIDVLVNNAALYGSLTLAPMEELDDAEFDACLRVNVKSLWMTTRAALPLMKAGRGGAIVNIASLAAVYGMPNGLHYTASKGAVIAMTRGMARELGRYNIRVNAVAPNVVDTDATGEVFGDKRDRIIEVTLSQQSLRRPLGTDDIVGAVLFLASDLNTMTTGQTLMVDGGTVFL